MWEECEVHSLSDLGHGLHAFGTKYNSHDAGRAKRTVPRIDWMRAVLSPWINEHGLDHYSPSSQRLLFGSS